MNAPSWIRSLNLWGVTKWYCFPFTSPGRGFRVVSINIWWIIEANVFKKYSVRETLNPKRSGNSRKRRWRRVLFPTPEGPERTSGRRHMGVKVTGVTTLLYYKFPSQLLIISSANIPSPNHGRITNHNGCSMLQCTSEPIIIHRFHSLTPHQPIDFDGEVNLFHFVLLRCVGKGAFGKVGLSFSWTLFYFIQVLKVRVVQHKQTSELYALKYINKAKCVKMRAVPNVIQERRLLEEVRSVYFTPLLWPDYFYTGRPSLYRQSAVCIPRRWELFLRNRSHARWRSSVLAFYLLHCQQSFSQPSSLSSPRKTRLNARRHCSLLCCSTLLRVDLFTRDGNNASVTILPCEGQPFKVSYLLFSLSGTLNLITFFWMNAETPI